LLGDSTLKGEGFALIRFETLDDLDIDPEKIISAAYTVRNLSNLDRESVLGLYAVTDWWCSINTRWETRPPYDKRPVGNATLQKAGDYSIDITPLLKEMIKNKGNEHAIYSVRNSFMIKVDTPNSNLVLSSGDGGLFSPFLEVMLME
jgi:hypothetical protein